MRGSHGGPEYFVAGLQIRDGVVESGFVALHFGGGVDRFGGFGSGFGSASVGRGSRVARFVDLTIALGEFFLQQGELFLLGLQGLT